MFKVATHNHCSSAFTYLCGLAQTERANMERMEEAVPDADYQTLQQFITDAPWSARAVMDRVAEQADQALGAMPDSCLLIDETAFEKKGKMSVGVARQYNGRLGKVENSQVAVFGVLCAGRRAVPVDARLYLPESWTTDPQRCRKAGVPDDEVEFRTKPQLAREIVRHQRELGVRFSWVGADGLYGNDPRFLRELEDMGEKFLIDVHADQQVYLQNPAPRVPRKQAGRRGRPATKPRTGATSVRVDRHVERRPHADWGEIKIRETEAGPRPMLFYRRPVWLWDGAEAVARQWQLLVRRELDGSKTKFSLTNFSSAIDSTTLANRQSKRFWIERSFQDAKSHAGMADYQVRKWRAWHHHMALVMMAMLFMTQQRMTASPGLPLLSCYDIRILLARFLPRRDLDPEELLRQMRKRHQKRQASIARAMARPPPSGII